jgi:hypothetical protein
MQDARIESHHFYNETERRGDYGRGGLAGSSDECVLVVGTSCQKFKKAQPARVTLVYTLKT